MHWQHDKWIRNLIFLCRLLSSLKTFVCWHEHIALSLAVIWLSFTRNGHHHHHHLMCHVNGVKNVCRRMTNNQKWLHKIWMQKSYGIFSVALMIFVANRVYSVVSWSPATLNHHRIIFHFACDAPFFLGVRLCMCFFYSGVTKLFRSVF